jgi:glycosyltransferase involved in cell wall biosynthesis
VTISTSLVLANSLLRDRFKLEHLDTSDDRQLENIGRWEVTNVMAGLGGLVRLRRMLRGRTGIVYLPLSQSAPGFLRDSLYIDLAARSGWKVAVHLRGSEFGDFYERSRPLLRWRIRDTMHRVTSVAVMGCSLRPVFAGLVPDARVAVVPNGTPEPHVSGTQREEKTVVFLSNLRRRKGVCEALDAALLVAEHCPDSEFVFAGEWEDEQLESDLSSRARAAGSQIRFVGSVLGKEKDALLGTSSILLFPPVEPEGHPRVVLEAMAAGLPVVTTDRGAIAETVIDGVNGFVLDEPDPKDLAERLLRLLSNKDLRRRMSEAARRRYMERFTQPEADRHLADWLSDIAGDRGQSEAAGAADPCKSTARRPEV